MNIRLSTDLNFLAASYHNQKLLMASYSIAIGIVTRSKHTDDVAVAVERIRYFIENILGNSIFIDQKEKAQIIKYSQVGLITIALPELPIDQIINMAIYCKCNAITEGRVDVTDTQLVSSLSGGVRYFFDQDDNLGSFVQKSGWWLDPDLGWYDKQAHKDAGTIVKMQSNCSWKSVGLDWAKPTHDQASTDNIVVIGNFGKKEE